MPTDTATTGFTPVLRVRIQPDNENHHLWNNHGVWFLHYTIHPTPFTKERIRRSLGTRDVEVARERRDTFLTHFGNESETTDPVLETAVA